MHAPITQPGSPRVDADVLRAARLLWRCEGRARGSNVGVQLPLSLQSCSALCSDVVDKLDWSYSCTRLCEAVCLLSRPCKNCSNYRCCGLQGLEIPCVRNVGLGLESWNFIWEHLSICQKCVVGTDQQIWVSLGLDALARVWYSWKAQWANRSQALLGQGRSVALNTEMNQAPCSWLAFFRVWTVLYLV